MNIRINENDFAEFRKATAISFVAGMASAPETGCILLVTKNRHAERPTILVKRILMPEDDDFSQQTAGNLVFAPKYLRRALLKARADGLSGFLTAHTHPFSDKKVTFSSYDDSGDPALMGNLYDLQPTGIFGSLVIGKRSIQGRTWDRKRIKPEALTDLIVVGERLKMIPLNGVFDARAPKPNEIFDRGLPLTGKGALAELSKMRIAVVGVSGTGSIVAELLLRAGVGEIVLIEFDHVGKINLNRILHSRTNDASSHVSKSVRIAEALRETELPTKITIIEGGDIRDEAVALELRGCDFIFGCVDNSDWARLVMTEVAYQYLIPYIDLGTEIGLGRNMVQSLDSRVSYIAPGRACLMCSGIVSEERLRIEGLATEEQQRVLAMGYVKKRPLSAPAVMDLNMRAASYATLVLRHLLQPFLDTPLPTHIKETVTNFGIRNIYISGRADCHICGVTGRQADGDGRGLTVRKKSTSRGQSTTPKLRL